MKIEIKKIGDDSYMIKLDNAMTGFVSRDELLEICEKIKRDGKREIPNREYKGWDVDGI